MAETSQTQAQQNRCNVCGQTFPSKMQLDDHYMSAHSMQPPTQQRQISSAAKSRYSGANPEKEPEDESEGAVERQETHQQEQSKRTWREAVEEESKDT